MSTLTKILAVLLVIGTLFLCSSTVTYVANADNYKKKHNDLKRKLNAAEEIKENKAEQYKEIKSRLQQTETNYSRQISELNDNLQKLKTDLNNSERKNTELIQKVSGFASQIESFRDTNTKKTELLDKTLKELKEVEARQLNQQKELEQTTATLIEKMAVIETLETSSRRLQEEKAELQNKLDQILRKTGKTYAAEPLTPQKKVPSEIPATGMSRKISLTGQVKTVDLKNSLASVSLGTADGVREGMVFHVTRGDEFICDILIIETEAEESVGVLELVQQPPRQGDNASTNLQ